MIRAVAIYAQAVLSQGLALKVLRDLQGAMFAKLTGADFARLTREAGGNLVSRFTNDITVIGEGLVRGGQVGHPRHAHADRRRRLDVLVRLGADAAGARRLRRRGQAAASDRQARAAHTPTRRRRRSAR